jgi:flagellar motility protein MotE (MotC chaperone)
LEFKTEGLTPEDASEVAKVVSSYNEYKGKAVAEAILKLRGKVSAVEFGREFSPVLYVHMPFWTHQVAGSKEISGRILTESENKANVDSVMSVLKKVKPDELDYDSGMNIIRAWWD